MVLPGQGTSGTVGIAWVMATRETDEGLELELQILEPDDPAFADVFDELGRPRLVLDTATNLARIVRRAQ
jgi:hypothetical protein